MDNSVVIARAGGWKKVQEGKGRMNGDEWRLGVVNTQFGVQRMDCRTVYLKPV